MKRLNIIEIKYLYKKAISLFEEKNYPKAAKMLTVVIFLCKNSKAKEAIEIKEKTLTKLKECGEILLKSNNNNEKAEGGRIAKCFK